MDDNKVSIIVPVYNAAKFIQRCVQSVIRQKYENFELILVNDGSKDESLECCHRLAEKDARIKVLSKINGGVSSARNYGLLHATGRYVCFIDADDWVEPTYLSLFMRYKQPYGLVVCEVMKNKKRKEKQSNDVIEKMSLPKTQVSILSLTGMQGFPVNKLFDNHLLKANGLLFDESITMCEDLLFAMQYSLCIKGNIIYIHYPTYHYEINDTGTTKSFFLGKRKFDQNQLSEMKALEKAENYIIKNDNLVKRVFNQRKTKAAVNCLRVLISHNLQKNCEYKTYYTKWMYMVRKGIFSYIMSPYTIMSAKLSVILSAFSPRIEFLLWKLHR